MNTHLEIDLGADEVLAIVVTDQDTGLPVNITGADLRWMVKALPDAADAAALLTKTTAGAGITITNGPAGAASITIAEADTLLLAAGMWWWELRGKLAGKVSPLARGRIRFIDNLIKASI